jgi:hypothetical protein
VPAEPLIEQGCLDQVPLTRAGGKAVEVDEHRAAVLGQDDVADVGVSVDRSVAEREAEALVLLGQLGGAAAQERGVLLVDSGKAPEPLVQLLKGFVAGQL